MAGEETLAQEVSASVVARSISEAMQRDRVFELLDVARDKELRAVVRERCILAELGGVSIGEGGDGFEKGAEERHDFTTENAESAEKAGALAFCVLCDLCG